ncbi:MAG: inositol monophosphatase family protein [Planctomycetota bacterium]|nr:inositol monophosphatase family protein [Planctomycetota bacterium]
MAAIVDFAMEIAREAGEILLARLGSVPIEYKGMRELVTEADRESERHLVRRIRERFPAHAIYAEEGARLPGSEGRWIIDPLDGTTNFVHQHPMFAVSIGVELKGELAVGVVWAPKMQEMFAAESGSGAWLNGQPMATSSTKTLAHSLLATGFAYDRDETSENNLGNFSRLLLASRGVRRGGSAALDLAYTAAGRFDGFWELWLQPYDVAAGVVLVREAGGRVTDFRGGDDYLFGQNIIASNGIIHSLVADSLDSFQGNLRDSKGDRDAMPDGS